MQEVISPETAVLHSDSSSSSDQPVFIIDPASKSYGSELNEFYGLDDLCKENIAVFGSDKKTLSQYLEFLTMTSSGYLDSSYFLEASDKKSSSLIIGDGQKHSIPFKTSFLKTVENTSLYRPLAFNMMMRLISAGNHSSEDFFRSGYNFFLPVKKESPFNCFDLCNPYLCYVRLGPEKYAINHQVLIEYNQTFEEDGKKELIKKRFKIFCSLIEDFESVKKYEEFLRVLNKDQYPLVVLSYEEGHLLKIDQSIAKVKKDFEKISKEIPSLNLDLTKLNPTTEQQSDQQQEQPWSSLFFVNPYFLLLKYGQVMDQLYQKIIDEISDLDSSKPNYSISCDFILKTLVYRNYSQLKYFFYNHQLPFDIFSVEIDKIDDLFRDYKWLSIVFNHLHKFLDVNCLESPYKKFPESFAPTILNFIAYCADPRAFDIALESGVSLRSLKHNGVLELVLIGSKQNEKENTHRFLLSYMNYGGDLKFLNKKSLREFIENIDPSSEAKFEKYKTALTQFTLNLQKFSAKRTKFEDRKRLLKEFIAVSELYIKSFDLKDYPHTNPENHNISLLEKFNREFSVFKNEDLEVPNIKINSLLNFVGFVEYLIGNGVIDYCFNCKTEDLEFKKDLELFKENISKLLKQFSKKSSIHQHFADLSSIDLEKKLSTAKSDSGKSLKRESVARQPLDKLQYSKSKERGGEKLVDSLKKDTPPKVEKPEVEKPEVEELSKKLDEESAKPSEVAKGSTSDTEQSLTTDRQKFSQSYQEIYDRNYGLFLTIFNKNNIDEIISEFREIYQQIEVTKQKVFVRSVFGYANIATFAFDEEVNHPLVSKAQELCNFLKKEFRELDLDSGWSKVPSPHSVETKNSSQRSSHNFKNDSDQKSQSYAQK